MQNKKNIVVTGGNSGIGYQTVKKLYSDGHYIIFGSRSQPKNAQAIRTITQANPKSTGTLKSFKLDLSKRASIEEFGAYVKSQFDHVDILINNAGTMAKQLERNQWGIELTMAANHFGPFYLTYLLFPLIKLSKEARIINVSSGQHTSAGVGISEDLALEKSAFDQWDQYAKSKLANVEFTVGLAERLARYPNIKTASLHPGAVNTNFGEGICCISFLKCILCCIFVNQQKGATTTLYLSKCPFSEIRNGQYYNDNAQWEEMNKVARNKEEVQKLWTVSERVFKIQFVV